MQLYIVHGPSGILYIYADYATVADGSVTFFDSLPFWRKRAVLYIAAGSWSAFHIDGGYGFEPTRSVKMEDVARAVKRPAITPASA